MRERSEGKTVRQGSDEAVIRRGVTAMAAAVSVRSLRNSLRVLI